MPTEQTQTPKPVMSQLVPSSELAPGEISSIRNEFIRKLAQIASAATGLPPNKLVVRDIRPKADLDYTYEDWKETCGATVSAYESMTTGTNGKDMWIGLFGVRIEAGCPISMLKFNVGSGDRAVWQLQSLRSQDDYVGFSPAGVVIPPSAPYTISRYVIQASQPAIIVLKGVVVERYGKVISP